MKPYKGFFKDVRRLYGECIIYGPYTRKSDRRRIVTINDGVKVRTHLYARLKLEIKLGRRLRAGETVDHIDDDSRNDRFDNLQLLTKGENSAKANSRPGRNYTPLSRAQYRAMGKKGALMALEKLAKSEERLVHASRVDFMEVDFPRFGWKTRLARELGVTKRKVDGLLKRSSSLSKRFAGFA